MAKDYDFGAINNKLGESCDCASDVRGKCEAINSDFINAMKEIWNSESSLNFVKRVSDQLNNFIDQFNQKFPPAINAVVDNANNFLADEFEGDRPIGNVEPPSIEAMSVDWSAVGPLDAGYMVPDQGDVSTLVQDALRSNVDGIKEILGNYSQGLIDVVDNQLHGEFCNEVSVAVSDLCSSAQDVVDTYVNLGVNEAIQAENLINSHRG